MSERIHPSLTRRSLIATLASGALAVSTTASAQSDDSGTYAVQQGDTCIPITPLQGPESASAFYDWGLVDKQYSSNGTTALQKEDTTIMFLYEDPDGTVSLVVVHEKLEDDSNADGGSVSFEVRGLPSGGSWVVKDDFYDGPSNYDVWNVQGNVDRIDWTWAGGRTDGGVFSPIGDDPDITIEPMFNEEAELFGEHYDGRVRNFEVLSGNLGNPDRHSLELGETVTIQGGTCEEQPTQPEEPEIPSRMDSPFEISLPNTINAGSNGFMMVEIRSTGDFDVSDLNLETLELDGASPIRVQEVPGRDGVIHVFFHVPTMNIDGGEGRRRMELVESGADGERTLGSDVVRIVPNGNGDGDDGDSDSSGNGGDGSTQRRRQERRRERTQNQGSPDNDNPGNPGDVNENREGENGAGEVFDDEDDEDDGNDALEILDDIGDGDEGDEDDEDDD